MENYLEKIDAVLKDNPLGLSVIEVAKEIGINRNSAARYLDVLYHQGAIRERRIGPAKVYIKASNLPFSAQLSLFTQAMNEASCGITIADALKEDMPLIYVNESFLKMTGYEKHEVIGKNCRFLQANANNKKAREQIRNAFHKKIEVTVVLKNYTKDGKLFYNELHLAPISSHKGIVTHYVGIQTDVSYRYKK